MLAPQEFLELLDNFSQICQIKSIDCNYPLIKKLIKRHIGTLQNVNVKTPRSALRDAEQVC